MIRNVTVKESLENQMAVEAAKRDIKAYKSLDYFKPNFTKENMPSKDAMMNELKGLKCDAVLTVTLIDKSSETRYVPGSVTYAPYPRFTYYGNFLGYYNHWYPMVYDPGYVTTDKYYYLESNLYNSKDEQLVWSAQSETVNPGSARLRIKCAGIL